MRTHHRWEAVTASLLTAGALTLSAGAAHAAPVRGTTDGAAVSSSPSPTPYQGWNTYFGLGGDFDQDEVLDVADYLVSSGLADAGYDIVWLDGGWQADVSRGDDGLLQGDPARFPGGMKALADAIHAKGLRAGIYTDAGPYIPGTCGLGSYGSYQTDADTFAAWGYDAVKVDFLCGITADLDPKTVFTAFSTALRNNSSHRPMIVNLCNPVTSPDWGDYPESQQSTSTWSYASDIAESWRTYTDVGFVGDIKIKDAFRNFDANARHPEVAGPGHFSDPDYLGPGLGMTDEQFRTQMTLWAIAAAPLVIGSDPRTLSDEALAILTDDDVLAVDQDPLGVQGTRVGDAATTEAWAKPLADGSVAVALVNRGDSAAEVSTTAAELGLTGDRFTVLDT
ncbi:glycoside hydrolase family 27 protein [Xylanimonas protaetiae]|uniref:glycoside hydrolase family 27 protein n=1 Tax=Xylanimonas protaetiae TaxID=2509457 RepID=UPI001A92FDE0|nr:glycoside hydrolase family 27 protein [Xylanimonas protaetiae]